MIRYSEGSIVDVLYTNDGTKANIISNISTALATAGWATLGGGLFQSATTPMGFKIQVDVIDTGGLCVHLRLRTPTQTNTGLVDGAFIFPVNGRNFRIMANKYQLFHYNTSATFTTDPCDVCFGVPYTPPFLSFPAPPFLEQDLISFSTTSADNCLGLVYRTWNFGPWTDDVSVRISGNVDDDIRVNGEIWDAGLFPFNSGHGLPCDGVANGIHDFDHTIVLTAGTPLVIEVINNFEGACALTAHLTIRLAGGIDPWMGWMGCNGTGNPGVGSNSNNVFGFHGYLPELCNAHGGAMWIFDTANFYDSSGGKLCRVIGQTCTSNGDWTENSGLWEDGSVSVYEPYLSYCSGHGVFGNNSPDTRHGQLWDAIVYGARLDSEVTVGFDDKRWRNVTQQNTVGGARIPHSLMLLTHTT